MRFGISSLITFAIAAHAAATQSTGAIRSINPPLSVVRNVDFASLPPAPESATNAKRFAQGLPPMRPRSRKHRAGSQRDVAYHKQGTRVGSAPRSEASPSLPVQQKCNMLAKAGSGTIGYLSRQLNIFGEYGTFQPNQDGALEISFTYTPGSAAPLDMRPDNGVTQAFPYVGGVISAPSDLGSNNFGPGTDHYAYIAATKQTPSGSPPVSGDNSYATATGTPSSYESRIWLFDPVTNAIRVQWVNDDGTTPTTYMLYANDGSDALIITGDPDTLNRNFETNYPQVTFTCVPSAA